MYQIPILEYKNRLIVSVQFELTDTVSLHLQESVLERIEKTGCAGLVIDISALQMVDSYIARVFMETAHMAMLMNTRTVIVGMSPEVAMTLITMGFSLQGVNTAIDLETGLDALDEMIALAEAGDAAENEVALEA